MMCIVTKFLGATNSRGSRIQAKCGAGKVTIPYPHEESTGERAHYRAAAALAEKLEWTGQYYGPMAGGELPDTTGYAFVFPKCSAVAPAAWR